MKNANLALRNFYIYFFCSKYNQIISKISNNLKMCAVHHKIDKEKKNYQNIFEGQNICTKSTYFTTLKRSRI